MDVEGMVAEIEEIVATRGLVAHDGQITTSLRRIGPWEVSPGRSDSTPPALHVRRRDLFGGLINEYEPVAA